jgi:hypothetical protein
MLIRCADGSDFNFKLTRTITGPSALPGNNWRWVTDAYGNEQLIAGGAGLPTGTNYTVAVRELGGAELNLIGNTGG